MASLAGSTLPPETIIQTRRLTPRTLSSHSMPSPVSWCGRVKRQQGMHTTSPASGSNGRIAHKPTGLTVLPSGKRALIGAQKSGVVTAVDPDRGGEIIWQKKVGLGGKLGGVQWGVG